MKGGTQAAVAIGVGYVLGRRRKMRLATLLVAAAATGGMGGIGGAALRRGAKMLGSADLLGKVAPQLGDIAGTVRGDLLDAGKAAAAAAVNNRLESLTDSLHERAEMIRDPAAAEDETGDRDADLVDEDEPAEDVDTDEEPEAPPRRRSARRSAPVARAGR
ncbi:MAG TPA: hypothetical protein VHU92_07410 [Streptosporangiaceae bacterium]|jgi:hypothetical protein|nr:hypothetical protein [Streptosporangiaceae bacterium]